MELNTLKGRNSKEIEILLASLSLDLLPNSPMSPLPHLHKVDPSLRHQLLNEIRHRLGLSPSDNSPAAKTKLYQVLVSEINKVAFDGVDVNKVRERAGQRGYLAPKLYKLEFESTFETDAALLGIGHWEVRSALRRPDDVKHLNPEEFGVEDLDKAFSLYMKERIRRDKSDCHLLLILTDRKGDVQHVLDAWRVYYSDVDLTRASTPLDILRAFVNVYGLNMSIGSETGVFFLFKKIRILPDQDVNDTNWMSCNPPDKDTKIATSALFSVDETERIINTAFAFTINETKYISDLKKHGVKVLR